LRSQGRSSSGARSPRRVWRQACTLERQARSLERSPYPRMIEGPRRSTLGSMRPRAIARSSADPPRVCPPVLDCASARPFQSDGRAAVRRVMVAAANRIAAFPHGSRNMTQQRCLLCALALFACAAGLASACGGSVTTTPLDETTVDAGAESDAPLAPDHDAEAGCPGSGECKCGVPECVDGAWTCPSTCGECEPPCGTGQVCVRDQFMGGPYFPVDDAGQCPPGRHPVNGQCVSDPAYACAAMPSTCTGGMLDCSCAGGLCLLQQSCPYQCESTQPGQVNCICLAP
jgi:hypothetical protein